MTFSVRSSATEVPDSPLNICSSVSDGGTPIETPGHRKGEERGMNRVGDDSEALYIDGKSIVDKTLYYFVTSVSE